MSAMLWSDIIIYAFSREVNAAYPLCTPCYVRHDWLITVSFSYEIAAYEDTNGHLPRLGVKFHPRSGSNVKFPTPGKREGVKYPWYARRGMLGIQK